MRIAASPTSFRQHPELFHVPHKRWISQLNSH